ncbi:MAG: hypothetical protein ABI315_00010 [Bacteroidia bacterium]
MDDRRKLIIDELIKQCQQYKVNEFEYYWEMWSVMWYPWFIEIEKNKSLNFTFNDISYKDLDYLVDCGQLELIKEYTPAELKDEFDRKRYRIKIIPIAKP